MNQNNIMSAYVLFTNGTEKIVPISLIETTKTFKNAKDFNRNHKVKVWVKRRGKGDLLLNAYILLLGSKYK